MRPVVGSVALAGLLLGACTPSPPPATPAGRNDAGVVVSGAPLASDVGARVLAEGGNAVDAAVATAFTLAVVEPTMSGIGGRSQILMRTPTGDVVGLDGTTEVPLAYPGGVSDEDAYGYVTIGIPGTVAVLAAALERRGSWPLARVLAPAIRLAEEGFALPAPEAVRIADEAARLREFAGSAAAFLKPDGTPWAAGERFRQPALAATLRTIAEGGVDAFYRGRIAAAIDADMRAHGGWLRATDLASYAPTESIIARGRYRGFDLIGTYLPASGATTIEALQIVERLKLEDTDSVRWVDGVARALSAAFDDREAQHGSAEEHAAWLTSAALAEQRAVGIRTGRVPAGARDDGEPPFTTHVSVVDRRRMAVALTQSVGPILGSRVATPGLGFVYAATMGYLGDLHPGERPWSSESPMIVLQGLTVRYVIGGAGARRIISGLVETLSHAMDGEPLGAALAAPRFHVSENTIVLERRPGAAWSERVEDGLRALGWTVVPRSAASYFARLNAIEVNPRTGGVTGLPDPRWPGKAAGR